MPLANAVDQSTATTNPSINGMIVDGIVAIMVAFFYVYKTGGLKQTLHQIKSCNWFWLLFEVGLPLGIPMLVGILVILGPYLSDSAEIPDPLIVVEELTPWTLCFFSMTILGSALRRLYHKEDERGWNVLTWLNLFAVTGFALVLTVYKHHPGWHVGFKSYSTAIFLTSISIWMSHAREEAES